MGLSGLTSCRAYINNIFAQAKRKWQHTKNPQRNGPSFISEQQNLGWCQTISEVYPPFCDMCPQNKKGNTAETAPQILDDI